MRRQATHSQWMMDQMNGWSVSDWGLSLHMEACGVRQTDDTRRSVVSFFNSLYSLYACWCCEVIFQIGYMDGIKKGTTKSFFV